MTVVIGKVKLESCAHPGNIYCVIPSAESQHFCADSCCPLDKCHTLVHYVADGTFNSSKNLHNTTFMFLPGEHQLWEIIYIDSVSNLKFQGKQNEDGSDVIIKCNSSIQAGLHFSYCSNLIIEGLKVIECGHCDRSPYCSAVQMYRVTNVSMTNVVITNTTGVGLRLTNLHGKSQISKTVIEHSSGIHGSNLELHCVRNENAITTSSIEIYNSTIQYGYKKAKGDKNDASGMSIYIACDAKMNITLRKLKVINNRVERFGRGGNIAIQYMSFSKQWPIRISIIDCVIAYGYAILGGGLYFNAFRIPGGWNDSVLDNDVGNLNVVPILTVRGTTFLENESIFGAGVYIRIRETEWPEVGKISFESCRFDKQRLHQDEAEHGGVAIHIRNFQLPVYIPHKSPLLTVEFVNCNFTNNIPNQRASLHVEEAHNGVLYIQGIDNATFSGCKFFNNNCSGIVSVQSLLIMKDENIIHNNTGIRGGGMVLCSKSIIFIRENSTLRITNNRAKENGGGIYIESECDQDTPHCFFQVNNTRTTLNNSNVYLFNNTALAGEALYGGMVDHCDIYTPVSRNYTKPTNIFDTIFHIDPQGNSAISSNPSSICLCTNETFHNETCTKNQTISVTIVPGSTIRVYVMLFGQRFGTVPGIVKAYINYCGSNNSCWISDIKETVQTTSQCTGLEYTIYSSSNSTNGTLQLVVKGSSFEYSRGQLKYAAANIHLIIEQCPLGSELNPETGTCNYLLSPRNSITHWIESKSNPPVWIGYRSMHPLPHTREIIYYKFCPLGYCSERRCGVNINTTYKSFDQDVQCAKHRTGLLCGKCKQNYSLGFGSSQCLAGCSTPHRYLQYLRVIGLSAVCAVAGILLVVLLTLLNLTVAEGTLNGLIFYANIVQVNLDLFFPSDTHARPWTTFIAWLNLDFGVTVCFYDGMDAYVKTWLQFIFPLYLWIISGGIVYFSRKSRRISRLAGNNSVKVLATLFLLSFGKLIRTVIAAGFFTNVKSYDGTVNISVWLLDANVHYLHGRHTLLFVVACLAGIVALLYALLLTFIQCLRRAPNSRLCGWILRLKPLLDAYTGPYKNKYHFWTGFLLLVRITLFICFALNSTDDPTINFVLIITVCAVLLVVIQPGIYRNKLVGYLESLMYFNLILFSATMMFTLGKYTAHRGIAAYLFGGLALVKFLGIVAYHAYKEWCGPLIKKKKKLFAGEHRRLLVKPTNSMESEDSPEEEENTNERGASNDRWLTANYREPLMVNGSP